MYILAFETSCDDTSIAIFNDDQLVFMDTISQIKEHLPTCGVVPEVAARLHANNIFIVLENVLQGAGIGLDEIDFLACTNQPGLLPSLYVGMTVSSVISKVLGKPLIFLDHIQSHMFSNLLERPLSEMPFPNICLTVSGGHNEIYLWKSLFERELLGQTMDDSAGEAFDKVAKMMGEGFPGGPAISRLASGYEGTFRGIFPKVMLSKTSLDFSFSGIKTAVKREIDMRIALAMKTTQEPPDSSGYIFETRYEKDIQRVSRYLTEADKRQIAFEFQETVTDILSEKAIQAASSLGIDAVLLAGGVSANDRLNAKISAHCLRSGYRFISPKKKVYSQDNAAMVGIHAYYRIRLDKI